MNSALNTIDHKKLVCDKRKHIMNDYVNDINISSWLILFMINKCCQSILVSLGSKVLVSALPPNVFHTVVTLIRNAHEQHDNSTK